jgi:phage tail sheath protein FI
VTNAVATANTFTNSSYLVVDNNYLKVYDKYNDQYVNIAASASTAGIMAASDRNTAPWFSPAGTRRGQYLGITSLAYSPNKSERDILYRAGINPIANIPGYGVLLYGDKTKLARPSAFDRINVRRLFLVIERAITRAAKQILFEFNDEFTRAEFVNIVEPFLREIQGRRGITDFRVVCDETNNTAAVIDRNEFVASIFIKPARSINYITLNFVATRTGAEFDEVVGLV